MPLYYQIHRQLLEQIQSGELPPGEPIPSEHEISLRLGVNRMTARQAVILAEIQQIGIFMWTESGRDGARIRIAIRQALAEDRSGTEVWRIYERPHVEITGITDEAVSTRRAARWGDQTKTYIHRNGGTPSAYDRRRVDLPKFTCRRCR